jgi:hypothetical protein
VSEPTKHEWAETFMRGQFPLVCRSCLVRSDSPLADYPCDRALANSSEGE